MAKKKPTYAELLQQRRKALFVGREEERKAFRHNFGYAVVPEHLIFAIHGQAGIGKSFLLARYQMIARENGALTALTNEAETTALREQSILQAMARLAKQLAEAGAPLKAFDEWYKKYRECMQEVEADPRAPQGMFDSLGQKTVQLAIGGARMVPGGQAVGGSPKDIRGRDPVPVEEVGAWTAYLSKKFEDQNDLVALVKEPVEALTPLFVASVNGRADERPVVLCFDTWERTKTHLDEWLRSLVERKGLKAGVWLVIAGRNPPGDEWEPFHPLMTSLELEEFTEEETRDYLKQQGIIEEARVADILAFSRGVPVLVSTLASAKGGSATEAASDPVDRYLKWVDDRRQRETALDCAAARRLDKDVVAAVMGGDDADELFDWLKGMPFVQSQPGYREYHPKVRKLMLKYARSRSLKDSQAVHGKLRAYYQGLSVEKGAEARYRDEVRQRHTLEALYHGLMQESAEAEREGLETFLLALRGCYPLAGEIAMTWQQAAEEQEAANEVTRWAEVLGAGWTAIESQSLGTALPFYEAMQERQDLSDTARSEVYFIGGLAYYELQNDTRATENFRRAIELNPELAPAYYDLQDYAQVIEDFERAIEMGPEYATAYYKRGNVYADLQDYARAIEDYGRAIELNPRYASAHNNRGNVYYNLRDYERAIEDYGRAIELDPEDATAYNNRGSAYYDLQAYRRAVEEYGRAIERNPEYATAYYNRGNTYYNLQDYTRAIEDYGRAIELNPEYATAYNNRGLAYAKLWDYARAIREYDRAIELNPEYATAYYNRACACALIGQTGEACEWLEKAIGLDEKHRQMARGNADFDGIREDERFKALIRENR